MKSLSGSDLRVFERVAARVVPGIPELDEARRLEFERIVDDALAARPAATLRQLRLFLRVTRWLPALRFGRPFDALAPKSADAFLAWLENCPIGRLRSGFWGVKTLVFMGYYGQDSLWPSIGYAPSLRGRPGPGGRAGA